MGIIKWLKSKLQSDKDYKTPEERRTNIEAILGPLVVRKIIDSKKTLSFITETLVNMGDPELEETAIMLISGIMAELEGETCKEFFLTVGMALHAGHGVDAASKLTNKISEAFVEAKKS